MASFRKRNKKWEYRISIKETGDDGKTKYKTVAKGGFATKKEAELAAAKRYESLVGDNGLRSLTLREFMLDWLENFVDSPRADYAPNTRKTYRQAVENHLLPQLGHIRIRDFNLPMYQRFLNKILEEFATTTARRIHVPTSLAFKQAVASGYLPFNPVQNAKIYKRERKRLKYLDPDLVRPLLDFLYRRNYDQGILFECMFESGMRRGEVSALQLNDIDWHNNTIRVDESYNFNDKDKRLDKVKTASSERVILMREDFMKKLRTYVKYRMEKREAVGALYVTEEQFVFGRMDGRPFPPSTLGNSFKAALKHIGYDDLPIHSTRHTHAVMMLEAGASMKEVQDRLGHSSIQVTADVYSHITRKMETRVVGLFDDYMQEKDKKHDVL